jgi:DNA-binding transcriptional regulator YiaG
MPKQTDPEFLKIARGVQLARSGAGKAVRLRAGVSQAAISARIGVTPAAVSLWESGERTPRGEHAARYFDLISLLRDEVGA